MKKAFASLFTALLAAALVTTMAGCPNKDAKTASANTAGGTFVLSKPSDVTLKRGDTAKVKISVDRKNNLNDALEVAISKLPKGVTVVETETKIAEKQSSAEFTLSAAAEAELVTNHETEVTVRGGGAGPASEKLNVTVKEK
jgi:uncharacterized lipoprotein YehR (DUF1307 family)